MPLFDPKHSLNSKYPVKSCEGLEASRLSLGSASEDVGLNSAAPVSRLVFRSTGAEEGILYCRGDVPGDE
eukprot:766984-Hanusia_phi.AAC.4